MSCPAVRADQSHHLPETGDSSDPAPGAPVSGFDKVARNIDAQNFGAEFRRRQGRRAVAAAEIKDLDVPS